MTRRWLMMILVGAMACTKQVNECTSDADCTNPAYPFCDTDGQYAASGGKHDVCTITPPDCPVERCGCTPGATTCGSDQLATCNADGMSVTDTACALGCGSDGTACATFTPSNGLGVVLAGAGAADVSIPNGATIDTDTGLVTVGSGAPVTVESTLVAQPDWPTPIRAYSAHSFAIGAVTITGADAVAFVATDSISINGLVDAAGHGSAAGPGARGYNFAAPGANVVTCLVGGGGGLGDLCGPGTGGGGNATAGGDGGYTAIGESSGQGAPAVTNFTPLYGGSSGGRLINNGTDVRYGGAGGGGIQLVAAGSVQLNGIIHVGGGGGPDGTGGGAGGGVIIEAPDVEIAGTGGIAANGGAGGGCGSAGADATPDTKQAPVTVCARQVSAGSGATGLLAPGNGQQLGDGETENKDQCGGGGGAAGRARIATRDGMYTSVAASILSVAITTDVLQPN